MNLFRLTAIRECRTLTPLGWGVLSIVLGMIPVSFVLFAYPFLAPTQPVAGEVLVVEGWLPDYALEKVKDRFENGNYKLLVTTGGHLQTGYHLSQYKTWAQLAASTLNAKGVPLEKIMSAPTTFIPKKDRTYNSVLEVRKRLSERGLANASIDVVSLGVHSRRTWLMFEIVFTSGKVGIVALEAKDYDTTRWWLSSAGVRNVISETVAYVYARLIFSPPPEPIPDY